MLEYAISYFWVGLKRINLTHVPVIQSQNSKQKLSLKTYSEETLKYTHNLSQLIKISKKIFLSFLKTTKLPLQIV